MEQESFFLKRKNSRSCYIRYTVYFCIVLCAILYCFISGHKSMVWDCDGVYQHFNSLMYYGKYLRGIFRNLWENHTLSIPLWDMSIGYGADILTTLNYYCFGDPLALTSAFVPAEYTEYLYEALSILRLYLSGCFFLMYCRYHQNEAHASVLGALTYAFSGFALYVFARHPFFMNPMMYFPLLLIGIDKIFDRKKPWLFLWMTALIAISNFYFFYMASILILVYASISYLHRFGRIRPKELSAWFFKFVGYYLIGVCIAAVTLLPSAMYVLNTGRMNADNKIPLWYGLPFYANYFRDILQVPYGTEQVQNYTIMGMAPLVLVALMVLFLKRKRFIHLKTGFLILTVFLLTPFCGHVMNGFSYAANRWMWAYIMLLSYILVKMYPELFQLKKKEKLGLLTLLVLYLAVVLGVSRFETALSSPETPSAAMYLTLLMLSVLCAAVTLSGRWKIRKALPAIFCGMTLTGLILNVWDLFGSGGSAGYLETFRNPGQPYAMLTDKSECYPVKELEDHSGFYRYDQYGVVAHENTAMQSRLNSTDYYFSVSNGAVSKFLSDLYVAARWDHMYDNLDGRTMLDRLAAVKYFVVRKGRKAYLPYSYDEKVGGSRKFKVFRSDETLPFGYTYKYALDQDIFDSLPVEQRQQAMMQAAVTEDSTLPQAEPDFCEKRPEIWITPDEHVTMDGNNFAVSESGAKITLSFEELPNCETYLVMKNLQFDGAAKNFVMHASMGDVTKNIYVYTNRHNFYRGYDDYLCNLGYAGYTQSVTLQFPAVGTYSMDELYVVCQPLDQLDAQTEALKENVQEDLRFSDNRISGTISLQEPKMLVLSMAYSKGWSALVDGKAQEVKQVNDMYPGLELSPGAHTIELRYRTPYLREGLLLSAFGLLIFCLLWILSKRRKETL